MPRLKRTSFDDSAVRKAVIDFFKKQFNLILVETPPEKKIIDLISEDDNLLGIEVEHGKWKNNFWENDSYSLISGQDFRTINIPIRKEKYWQEHYVRYGKEIHNPSYKKNLFVRSNIDFTQFIIIRPETIRDVNKVIRTKFQPNNSHELEDWLSFRKEHVETYNLIDGLYILDNEVQ